jgi:hypothetical protein
MNAARVLEHFHRISDAPDAIRRMRRFILDLAVRGKLVSQDPKDEPASELLKRIAAEKARLMKGRAEPVGAPEIQFTLRRVGHGHDLETSVRRQVQVARREVARMPTSRQGALRALSERL